MTTVCLLLGLLTIMQQSSAAPAASQPVAASRPVATGFLDRKLVIGEAEFAYSVFIPADYTPDRAWPAILFLHGSGERGDDGLLQTEVGIATAIRRNRRLCPAIVVMPQCPAGAIWADANLDMAMRCVQHASQDYHIDAERLYLTGLSLGGMGAWILAARAPQYFAAVVPICGFYSRPDLAPDPVALKKDAAALATLPVWAWHGGVDKNVPPQRSREIIAAIREAGGDAKYTEVPDAAHNVWDRAYADAALWDWLLRQKRRPR
jgi:predicted peptidase